ncbi:mannose/fructose/sorbose PTS transporter subunit IIB [Carnobacterium antarcticum]|uniref:Mannose/fructose/sorbose PTS transporter subunit IIB n=1 Tax=Carnobacterium antarcticum TaxID=2126436 RepID=A0ABW4NQY8_9LACT|nr:mannose/fructose/sorbose PTS transporter subunit IIB [Carnobacterium sp. CP1]ALV22759.1 PTS system, mannose-specific IIB component [Carnobacterium sp. CP1]
MTMDIRLVRIDDRLIHGQVATVWAKVTKVNRILVVSDEVAKDTLRKTLLKQAAPPGVAVNVIAIDKMISIADDPKFSSFKALLLFTNPQDVRRVVEGGISLRSVNIGGMSFSDGKKMITNAVAVNDKDVEDLKFLNEQGIELEIRKVVADNKVNMMDLLKKENLL